MRAKLQQSVISKACEIKAQKKYKNKNKSVTVFMIVKNKFTINLYASKLNVKMK